MMNTEQIYSKINFISTYLEHIKETTEELEKNDTIIVREALERMAEKVVETATKINQEILTTKKIIPKSYRDTFEQLKHFNIFEEKTLQQLANTTGFRNRLAHEYDDLDQEITIESIKQLPKLYKHYLKIIMEFIENYNN